MNHNSCADHGSKTSHRGRDEVNINIETSSIHGTTGQGGGDDMFDMICNHIFKRLNRNSKQRQYHHGRFSYKKYWCLQGKHHSLVGDWAPAVQSGDWKRLRRGTPSRRMLCRTSIIADSAARLHAWQPSCPIISNLVQRRRALVTLKGCQASKLWC